MGGIDIETLVPRARDGDEAAWAALVESFRPMLDRRAARLLAGESSSRAAAFGTGMPLDVMPACPDLALLADQAAGPDDSYAGASDDELIGVLCAWDRTESHAHARKLAAIAELRRRQRPDGRWPLDWTLRGAVWFDVDDGPGRPSRWITLRALRVLRWCDRDA